MESAPARYQFQQEAVNTGLISMPFWILADYVKVGFGLLQLDVSLHPQGFVLSSAGGKKGKFKLCIH